MLLWYRPKIIGNVFVTERADSIHLYRSCIVSLSSLHGLFNSLFSTCHMAKLPVWSGHSFCWRKFVFFFFVFDIFLTSVWSAEEEQRFCKYFEQPSVRKKVGFSFKEIFWISSLTSTLLNCYCELPLDSNNNFKVFPFSHADTHIEALHEIHSSSGPYSLRALVEIELGGTLCNTMTQPLNITCVAYTRNRCWL